MAIHSESPRAGLESRSWATPVHFVDDPAGAYRAVRAFSAALCEPLEIEDYGLQSTENCSPAKWHLAHTTWFFETFVLAAREPEHRPFHEQFGYLFNSYYETVGRMHPRRHRGLLTRPTVSEVYRYREQIDARVLALLDAGALDDEVLEVVELGLHHEQQHQELILTDLKHGFSCNPLLPAYRRGGAPSTPPDIDPGPIRWIEQPAGVARIGHARRGLRVRQRGAVTSGVHGAAGPGFTPDHLRRVPGVHGRRRLRAPRAVALAGLGCGAAPGLGGPRVLGP